MNQPDSVLTTLGGLVTELNPADLPTGSSPLCCDCDFTIGSVKTRYGLGSVYAAVPLSEGVPGSLSQSGGIVSWTNLNGLVANYSAGSASVTLTPGQSSYAAFCEACGLDVPGGASITGVSVSLTAQVLGPDSMPVTATLVVGGVESGTPITLHVNGTYAPYVFGSSGTLWGLTLTPSQVNASNFGVVIQAQELITSQTLSAYNLTVTVYYADTATDFDWIKTFEQTDGTVLNLTLDNAGTLWQENIATDSGTLTPFYSGIAADTFAKSVTEDDREFIAFSDLRGGTDMPRQYDGMNLDRISQVGPGAGVQVSSISTSYTITSISQIAAQALGNGTSSYFVLWSAGPTLRNAGNVVTFYGPFGTTWTGAGPTGQLQAGDQVVIAGVQTMNGFNPNSGAGSNPTAYLVTSVGTAIGSGGRSYPIFTIQVNEIGFYDNETGSGSTYQPTLATVVTSVPVPNMQVGSQLTITGASPATWDGTFTVIYTPNASQMAITSTVLSSNTATYSFTLISGSTPTMGEQVTVAGTGNGDGIFNVTNAVITATGTGTFSVTIISPNIASAPESGNAIVNGTKFQFDPGQAIASSSTGALVVAGLLGAGARGAVVMFLTRNGYLTAPSPQTIFTLSGSASSINVSQIPIGPPEVVARVIAFTGAGGATLAGGGGFYYWIPAPVKVISNNQLLIYSATIINDNVTTQATFTFTDAVLLDASGISTQGSNNFAQIELGSCTGLISYSSRLFAWGENNKIQNLLNTTFDGGIGQIIPPPGDAGTVTQTYPLGWTIDAANGIGSTNGGSASVVVSPVYGNSYYIKNTSSVSGSGSIVGMIEQSAYQDGNGVPIITTNTVYSVRAWAFTPSGQTAGQLTIDLFSPSLGRVYGTFAVPCSSMTTSLLPFVGTILIAPFTIAVPSDLLLRVYGQNLITNGDIELDRFQIYDTNQPVLSTQLRGSYENNFEAFDGITGNLGVGEQNQQPIKTAFCLFDNLYIVRSRSFCSTADNGITEPSLWTIREIAGIGTPSINGVDYNGDKDSESWALIAGQAGLYLFDGGQPQKISPEIDTLWQSAINWNYGYTLWVKNDIINRRVLIGVPVITPNQWMPKFPANSNPTQPNVVLMMNYRELMTSGAVESEGSVRQSYMGELRTFQLGRKWSAWSIQAAYADFVTRPDTTQPLFFCSDTNNGKIYQQLTGSYLDDGNAIPWQYIPSPQPKTQEAQALGMGNDMLLATDANLLLQGNGSCALTIYPDTITSPYAEALLPVTMGNPPAWGDTEVPLNASGARFFLGLSSGSAGSNFELSRIVMKVQQHPFAPLRGSN